MYSESGVNPSECFVERAELPVQSVTVSDRPLRDYEAPPPYSLPHSTVVTDQPIIHQTIIIQAPLQHDPVYYNCPQCQERILTKVKYINSAKTHLLAGFLFGLTCWCLICCVGVIPYYLKSCKSTEHYCPFCETLLGTYSKF